jgi:hypothetical protein
MKIALILSSLAMLTASASVADRNPPAKVPILKDDPSKKRVAICPRANEGYFTEISGVLKVGGDITFKGPCFGQRLGSLDIYIVRTSGYEDSLSSFNRPTRWSGTEAVFTMQSFRTSGLNFKAPERIFFLLHTGSGSVRGYLTEDQFAALQRGEAVINPPRQ